MAANAAKILVVDDDPIVRCSLERVLTTVGHEVEAVGSGVDAVRALAARAFELVILDLRMPRLGGLTVLQHVQRNHSDVPVVVMTGFPSIENATECIQMGAFDFLQKPLDPDRVRQVVACALAGRPWCLQRR